MRYCQVNTEDGAGGFHAAYFSDMHLHLYIASSPLPCRDHQSFRLAYFRFALSFRDVEEMLAMRGVVLSYETVREWCLKFGQTCQQETTAEMAVAVGSFRP